MKGTFAPATLADDIWPIIFPSLADGRGWPQPSNASEGTPAIKNVTDGTWAVPTSYGGPAQEFSVEIFTASATASATLKALVRTWASTGRYVGIARADLPPGLTLRARLTVRRGPLVKILEPAAGAVVPVPFVQARGTVAKGVTDSVQLLVCPALAAGRCWPQTSNAAAGLAPLVDPIAQTWRVPVNLGGPQQDYDLIACTADPSATSRLRVLLIDWAQTGNYVGLASGEWPDGLVEHDRIRIRR
jgi:hypothetical protein